MNRPAEGMPVSTIVLPYKICGVTGAIYMHYSKQQLSLPQLTELESNPLELATELSELSSYSDSNQYDEEGEAVRQFNQVSDSSSGWVERFADKGVAAVLIQSTGEEITFRYSAYPTDNADDSFVLRDIDNDWFQQIYLRETESDSDGASLIRFSGWPKETEKVDLVRVSYCAGEYQVDDQERSESTQEIMIYSQVALSELLDAQNSEK
ncbi:hypothetical protein [Vibrio sp. WXL103]|uniref:hypothetical protein n=1 Tax=Vibrio sp. WXL103 TaxID=3450710 RepID=UPI003EC56528